MRSPTLPRFGLSGIGRRPACCAWIGEKEKATASTAAANTQFTRNGPMGRRRPPPISTPVLAAGLTLRNTHTRVADPTRLLTLTPRFVRSVDLAAPHADG